jgi:c-di-GMP-binding flagellar brake protein YcgR
LGDAVKPIKAELRDISAGGALFYCQDSLELNETLQMVIKPPDGDSLEITIELVWSDFTDDNTPRTFGARFIEISEQDRRYLLDVISQLRDGTAFHH